MNLQLKKSLGNPGRNLTTLTLLPDFFSRYDCFCILYFHLWASFPPYISPLTGQKVYGSSCHLASFTSEGSGLGFCSEEKESREEKKENGENSLSGVTRSEKQLLSLLLGVTQAGITQGEMCLLCSRNVLWFGAWVIWNQNQRQGKKQPQLWKLHHLIKDEPVHLWINKAKEEFPVSLSCSDDLSWRWDVAVEGSDGKIASALAGILFFGCARDGWQRIMAVKKITKSVGYFWKSL